MSIQILILLIEILFIIIVSLSLKKIIKIELNLKKTGLLLFFQMLITISFILICIFFLESFLSYVAFFFFFKNYLIIRLKIIFLEFYYKIYLIFNFINERNYFSNYFFYKFISENKFLKKIYFRILKYRNFLFFFFLWFFGKNIFIIIMFIWTGLDLENYKFDQVLDQAVLKLNNYYSIVTKPEGNLKINSYIENLILGKYYDANFIWGKDFFFQRRLREHNI